MSSVAGFFARQMVGLRGGLATKRGTKALKAGDGALAVKEFADAVAAKTEFLGTARHSTVARAMVNLAAAHRLNGDEFTAASTLTEAVDVLQTTIAPDEPEISVAMNNLAVMLRNTRQTAEAKAVFAEALRLASALPSSDGGAGHDYTMMQVNASRNELVIGADALAQATGGGPTADAALEVATRAVVEAEELLRSAIAARREALPVPSLRLHGMMMDGAADDDTLARAMSWLAEALVLKHQIEEHSRAAKGGNGSNGAEAEAVEAETTTEGGADDNADMIGEFDYSDMPPLLAEALTLFDSAAAMHGRLLGDLHPDDLEALVSTSVGTTSNLTDEEGAAIEKSVKDTNTLSTRDDVQLLRRRREILSLE